MLQPLKAKQEKAPQEILRTCEACATKVESSRAINCIIVIGSPGHPDLAPFQCEQEEHWACSIECWRQVAHACIDEHMHELLKMKHEGL